MRQRFAGVDLGGTAIKMAVADETGQILASESIPTHSHRGPQAVLESVANGLSKLLDGDAGELGGVGIGVPGLVDLATGTTRFLPNLPTQWRNVAVAKWLSERLVGCPVRLLNDARAAALGESHFGHGSSQPKISMAFFTLGTGVGGGIVLQGKLHLGPLGAAGELGHQTVLPNGPLCGCGNRGCLETLASGPAISAQGIWVMRSGRAPALHAMVGGDAQKVTTREMAQVCQKDDSVRQVIVNAAQYIGIAAANVVTILHPDLIVLGGGVAEMGDLLLETVRQTLRERVGMMPADSVRVERSMLGDQAGLMGAIALALNKNQWWESTVSS